MADQLTELTLKFAQHSGEDCEEATSVHIPGAWSHFTWGSPGSPDEEAKAQAKAKEARHAQERYDSQERCDTDGFLSQWASGISSNEAGLAAHVAAHGGMDLFPALFLAETGQRVRAKLTETKWGSTWALCDETGKFTGEFFSDSRGSRAALAKRGLVVIGEWAPAKARIVGVGTGLSGRAWATTVRTDLGFPEGSTPIRK
jgi:hypothetical protein